jgi:hypothetical protein
MSRGSNQSKARLKISGIRKGSDTRSNLRRPSNAGSVSSNRFPKDDNFSQMGSELDGGNKTVELTKAKKKKESPPKVHEDWGDYYNSNELSVHRDPDLPLACPLSYRSPTMLALKKKENLQRLNRIKENKLEL